MIAADLINDMSDQEGARAIDEIVNTRLVAKISEQISDRIDAGLPVDSSVGAFVINTNGNASFEGGGRQRADIKVEFRTLEEIQNGRSA